jgi:hypothetical protein
MKEVSFCAPKTSIDFLGNFVFIGGLTSLLVGVTYGLMPYKHDGITDAMGWGNPWVIRAIIVGILLLIIFPFYRKQSEESYVPAGVLQNPGFHLRESRQFHSSYGCSFSPVPGSGDNTDCTGSVSYPACAP